MAVPTIRRRNEPLLPYIAFWVSGVSLAVLIVMGFFLKYHAFEDFIAIGKRLIPYYASIGNRGIVELIPRLIPRKTMYPLLLLTLVLTVNNKDWKNWERQGLALILFFSALSFLVQGKGFVPHRNSFVAFLLLWMALESAIAMKRRGWPRILAATIAVGFLCAVPGYCYAIYTWNPKADLTDTLELDLKRLGGTSLEGQVQCMDLVAGCLNALYRLDLVQYSGFMGDYMFFGPPGSTPLNYYRTEFLNDFERKPPRIVVVTTQVLSAPDSFNKIAQWPEFVKILDSRYTLDVTRVTNTVDVRGYKIYRLNQISRINPP
jgi:hypothetical protein